MVGSRIELRMLTSETYCKKYNCLTVVQWVETFGSTEYSEDRRSSEERVQ